MGYCHYRDRPLAIDPYAFSRIRVDFEKLILPLVEIGFPIAGPFGMNEPEITDDMICFNGLRRWGIDIGTATSFNPNTLQTFSERRRCDGRGSVQS